MTCLVIVRGTYFAAGEASNGNNHFHFLYFL
jgi:hypothetical protein